MVVAKALVAAAGSASEPNIKGSSSLPVPEIVPILCPTIFKNINHIIVPFTPVLATVEHVRAGTADQHIVAPAAVQRVVASVIQDTHK